MPVHVEDHESVDLEAMRAAGFTADEARLAVRAAHSWGTSRFRGALMLGDKTGVWQELYDQARSTFPARRAIMRDTFVWTPARAAWYAEACAEHPNSESLLELIQLALTTPHLNTEELYERVCELGCAVADDKTAAKMAVESEQRIAQQLTALYTSGQICRVELKRTFQAVTARYSVGAPTDDISRHVHFAHLVAYSQNVPDGDLREPLTITALCCDDFLTYLLHDNDVIQWTHFPSDHVRRYLDDHQDVFSKGLNNLFRWSFGLEKDPHNFVTMLHRAGQVPEQFLATIARIGFREEFRDTAGARNLLGQMPGWQSYVLTRVVSSKTAERKLAAACIHGLPHADLEQPLRQALDGRLAASAAPAVISAYVAVLAHRGGSIDQADVERFARHIKKLPKAIADLPLSDLPELAWRNGEPMSAAVQRWLLVTLITEKSPQPSPVLRQAFALAAPGSVSAFARTATSVWVEHDIGRTTPEQAQLIADQKLPQVYDEWKVQAGAPDKTRAQVHAEIVDQEVGVPRGSAASWNGLLSVVALCDDKQVVAEVLSFIHRWYTRSKQAQFLIEVLGSRRDEPALAALVEVKQRNTSQLLRRLAAKVLDVAIKELGLCQLEVALRAVPHFELSLAGHRTFTEGNKTYTATLKDNGTFTFTNPAGKTVKSMPWQWARTEITQIRSANRKVKPLVTELWRDAIATERQWSVDHWRDTFLHHPLLVGFATRSVWQEVLPDGGIRSFRPAGDGSFTDALDEDVPAPHGAVRLAYCTTLSGAERAAWKELFADYGLQPVVNQCDLEPVVLADDQQTHFADYVGHMVHQRGFKSQARKVGYLAECHVAHYVERWCRVLSGGELTVVLCSTPFDTYMPEDVPVALRGLYVARTGDLDTSLRLSELPASLVTQVHADYQLFGNSSTGFDPEWQKKTL